MSPTDMCGALFDLRAAPSSDKFHHCCTVQKHTMAQWEMKHTVFSGSVRNAAHGSAVWT